MANPTAINPNAIDAAAAIASNVQWPSPPVNSLSLIARWCCSRRDQHVSMDELQSHVMPYARPRAAVATQFNVVEVPGKRECGPPASWTIESQKPCASMVLEDLSSRIARQVPTERWRLTSIILRMLAPR